jgi:hypothetical protein
VNSSGCFPVRNAGSGIFSENEKILVAPIFEAASFVARTEQAKGKKRGKGSAGLHESETNRCRIRSRKMAEKFPKIT